MKGSSTWQQTKFIEIWLIIKTVFRLTDFWLLLNESSLKLHFDLNIPGELCFFYSSSLVSYFDLTEIIMMVFHGSVFGSHCHQLFLPVTLWKKAEYSYHSLSLTLSDLFLLNYTSVIKQDISSGDPILRCFRWPPCATPELSEICWC